MGTNPSIFSPHPHPYLFVDVAVLVDVIQVKRPPEFLMHRPTQESGQGRHEILAGTDISGSLAALHLFSQLWEGGWGLLPVLILGKGAVHPHSSMGIWLCPIPTVSGARWGLGTHRNCIPQT